MSEPTRPALRWHGGKWLLAPWIIRHMPEHRVYVEPFGGAASVLLRKPRSYGEIYNDLDDDAVTLFRVLRDAGQAAQLINALELTPFARAEFQTAYEPCTDPVERARRLIARCFMGFGSNSHATAYKGATSTGFRSNSNRSGTTPAHDWRSYPDALRLIVERLAGVVIENRDAFDIMVRHDGADTLHFVDPPYLHETRSIRKAGGGMRALYRHELSRSRHEDLLRLLRDLKGMVLLCGYPDDMYDAALADWRRVQTPALADGARPRMEVLWISPAAVAALEADSARPGPLFAGVGA
ncbi:hypothetical protein IZ6_07600 [Terrihabitans soli]|uniref:Site-specific DNA-methyltransferase (adenine-specific) n=1 Tax=Terrihabitans soli TaxID=708113 RepID=A0A6S6QQI4_9HYPH|nr:DNA adenine methylase [Terrihabitans soli]BCJ90025.1 hypothetical protein IZ6_07600 [Terrihabitans soli]